MRVEFKAKSYILSIKVTETLIKLDYKSDIAEFGPQNRCLKLV